MTLLRRAVLALTFVLAFKPGALHAQADTTSGPAKVFVDCQAMGCDQDFFVDQLKWVNFVRDRLFADVTILVTSLRTGAGGQEMTVSAIGGDRYKGRADTVRVVSQPNDASDVIRRRLLRTFSLLLGPYAARTSVAENMSVSYLPLEGAPSTPMTQHDPWNFWVYRISANGFGNGEKSQTFGNLFFNANASRTTAAWKLSIGSNLSYDQSKFDLSDGTTFTKTQRNYGLNSFAVKSIDDHWSVGATAQAQYSDFDNLDLSVKLQPGVEWDFFPYKEFTSRQLTVFYAAGINSTRYQDTTIYGRISETHPQHNINVTWNARQTWGSVNMSVYGSQYLHDRQYYSYGISSFADLRLSKGLSFNLGGNYSRVNDQLSLRKGTLTDNEIIARQQALATNYRYFISFGVSYTFGSIFNTVVNPRFGSAPGGGGGGMMMFSF